MLDVQKIRHKAENMSRMKTFICAGTLSLLGVLPAWSLNSITDVFAGCAGRYSAEMEHAWLMGADTAAHFADQADRITAPAHILAGQGRTLYQIIKIDANFGPIRQILMRLKKVAE